MDKGARQATIHGVLRVGHSLVTKAPPPLLSRLQTTRPGCLHLMGQGWRVGVPDCSPATTISTLVKLLLT